MSLNPQAAPALQFDTATPAKTQADAATQAKNVTCAVCQRTITDKYFDVNGQSTCDRCKVQIVRQTETPTEFGVFVKAALFGLGAAILGAIVYYAVIAITNYEIGLVAIAIGFMVGYAVRKATDNRGGLRFQLLAVVFTYWAVGLAYTPFLFADLEQGQQDALITPASTAVTEPAIEPAAATAPDSDPESAAAETPLGAAGVALAFGIMFALTWALPVINVVGSMPGGVISAAIIGFGMMQAWQMTAAPSVVITGPFRIAPRPVAR